MDTGKLFSESKMEDNIDINKSNNHDHRFHKFDFSISRHPKEVNSPD